MPLWLPTMLLDFQEYVCFLIKGTNTTGSSPSPASSCLEHGHDAGSRRSHLPAARGKGQGDHRVAGSPLIHPATALPASRFLVWREKCKPLLIKCSVVHSPKHSQLIRFFCYLNTAVQCHHYIYDFILLGNSKAHSQCQILMGSLRMGTPRIYFLMNWKFES